MNTKADQHIQYHLTIPTGHFRLFTILSGLELEIKIPGMRMTRKAPKCSTILRKEFGLSGKPQKLYDQFLTLLVQHGVPLPARYATAAVEPEVIDPYTRGN
jgi:hypothetical protein